jgi:hypothetical protein
LPDKVILKATDWQFAEMVHALRRCAGYTMYRRTYISKVLEDLSAAARKLRALRMEGKQEEAMETLLGFYKSVFPEHGAAICDESPEQIISQSQLGIAVLDPIADIFTEEAELLIIQGMTQEASKRGKKALTLLNYLDRSDTHTYSQNRKDRMQVLEGKYNVNTPGISGI